ncbi:MAG: hypothetical protein KAS32_30260 [Candidatus Peribacteraceae bacterium]|nr:hypothetical protein [Candidatus Peribacteraceae bacterium]
MARILLTIWCIGVIYWGIFSTCILVGGGISNTPLNKMNTARKIQNISTATAIAVFWPVALTWAQFHTPSNKTGSTS